MKSGMCEGFPHVGCENEATNDMLGYQICDACADNWRGGPTREDQHAGAQIVMLREQLDQAHAHIGALLSEGCDDAARDAARAWLRREEAR